MIIKKLFLALILLASVFVSAQEITSSPYSFYGLGDVTFKGTHDVRSMGGLEVAYDSIHLNLLNPASYSRLKLTSFAVGGTTSYNFLSNEVKTEKSQRTAIDYLAIGFPLGKKIGLSFGLMPFSSVGYKVQNIAISESGTINKIYTGNGGINRTFFGFAYNISDKFSLGLDYQYNFGEINTESINAIPSLLLLNTSEKNVSNVRGSSFKIGGLYNFEINKKYNIATSFSYTPQAKLTSDNTRNLSTFTYSNSGIQNTDQSVDVAVATSKLVIPAKYSVGTSIGKATKWLIGVGYTFQESKESTNRFDGFNNVIFENSNKFVVGGYFIPKYNSFTSYWSRVNYRAGFRYENTGLVLNTKPINDYGINFGLGLPVGGSISNINIGFEYGKRGTVSHNLIEENYFNINVGLSLSDIWFKKRKYD